MLELFPKCGIQTVPLRLHTSGREKAPTVANDDRVFIRHEPLGLGEVYGCRIAGHDSLEDQSANSEFLNGPKGFACDVLFDCKNGEHYVDYHFACLNVSHIHQLAFPNANTIRRDRFGNIIQDADIYTFEVVHMPTPCMYPHCEILAKKNGIAPKKVAAGVKTIVRAKFAELAELNRLEMIERRAKELPRWNKELKRSILMASIVRKSKNVISLLALPCKGLLKKVSSWREVLNKDHT